ncbi:hypothetical protein ACFLYB_03195 [Chloroflexota bacterium]
MIEAEIIANEHWQWQSCDMGMIYRNTPALGFRREKKKVNDKQAVCSKTCFWFNKSVCRYSDITSHICTKKEKAMYYMARKIRLINAN